MLNGTRTIRMCRCLTLCLCVLVFYAPTQAHASWWEGIWKYVAEKLDRAEKTEQSSQTCAMREPATGKEFKILDPLKPSSCMGIKLCHYCKYDSDGEFIENGADLCGVCLIAETP